MSSSSSGLTGDFRSSSHNDGDGVRGRQKRLVDVHHISSNNNKICNCSELHTYYTLHRNSPFTMETYKDEEKVGERVSISRYSPVPFYFAG